MSHKHHKRNQQSTIKTVDRRAQHKAMDYLNLAIEHEAMAAKYGREMGKTGILAERYSLYTAGMTEALISLECLEKAQLTQ